MTLANKYAKDLLSKTKKTNINKLINKSAIDKKIVDTISSESSLFNSRIEPNSRIKDSDWIQLSFLNISKGGIYNDKNKKDKSGYDKNDQNLAYLSSASVKFTDSSIGGNICINPPPQFTPYADIRPTVGEFTENQYDTINCSTKVDMQSNNIKPPSDYVQNQGMGRYYSEAIDDRNRIIHMRFGKPQYNSMWGYFKQFYSPTASYMAREGKFTEEIIVKGLGGILAVAIAPLMILPFTIMMLGAAVNFIMKKPTSKFYNLKPTMHVYWTSVEAIVNQISINSGLTYPDPPVDNDLKLNGVKVGNNTSSQTEGSYLNSILPKEYMSSGQLNVFYIINKTKIKQMKFEEGLRRLIDESGNVNTNMNPSILNKLIQTGNYTGSSKSPVSAEAEAIYKISNIGAFINHYVNKGKELFRVKENIQDEKNVEGVTTSSQTSLDPRIAVVSKDNKDSLTTNVSEGLTLFLAGLGDASQFLSIRVDDTGTVQESFSNSSGESSIAGLINSKSKQFSEYTRYGKQMLESVPIVGELLTSAITGVTNVLGYAADKWGIGGLLSFAGNSFADMPKQWESSSCRLPTMNYTVSLTSPYGDPLSQLMNIYLPLATLLAAALPLSTGKQSYTSPYLCELYDRGRCISRLAMIDSLSITRGTGNLGFNNLGKALAIDVSFSITDLSSIVSVPVTSGFNIPGLFDKLFDDENAFTDYMLTLSGVGLTDIVYALPRLKRSWKGYKADWNSLLSTNSVINRIASDTVFNVLGVTFKGVNFKQ